MRWDKKVRDRGRGRDGGKGHGWDQETGDRSVFRGSEQGQGQGWRTETGVWTGVVVRDGDRGGAGWDRDQGRDSGRGTGQAKGRGEEEVSGRGTEDPGR